MYLPATTTAALSCRRHRYCFVRVERSCVWRTHRATRRSPVLWRTCGTWWWVCGRRPRHHALRATPVRSQARVDVYDAGIPAFPTAASLPSSVFDATNIQAAPYLGSLIGDAGFAALIGGQSFATVTFSLAPYVGKTVYFAYRSSNNRDDAYQVLLIKFVISC